MSKDIPLSVELLHGRPVSCEARREGDEFACACGKRWGVDDPEPPACSRARHIFSPTPATVAARAEIVRPAIPVKPHRMPKPEDLTDEQLDRMGMAVAMTARLHDGGPSESLRPCMRAAYRALFDSLDS